MGVVVGSASPLVKEENIEYLIRDQSAIDIGSIKKAESLESICKRIEKIAKEQHIENPLCFIERLIVDENHFLRKNFISLEHYQEELEEEKKERFLAVSEDSELWII